MLVYILKSHYDPDSRLYVTADEGECRRLLSILNESRYDYRAETFDTEDDLQRFLLAGGRNYFVCAGCGGKIESADFDPTGEEPLRRAGTGYTMTVRATSQEEAVKKAQAILDAVKRKGAVSPEDPGDSRRAEDLCQ